MGYVPTGGSGGASIGGSVSGATAGSVFFAGTSGVLAQNNTRFFWDNTNFNLIAGGATYRTILGQMSSPLDNYSGIRFAGAGEAVLGTSNSALWGGATATVLNVPSGTIYFRVGGSTDYATLDTTSFTAKAASASRVPLTVELAAAQSADAFQVKNSGGTTIASIDKDGRVVGQVGALDLRTDGTLSYDSTNFVRAGNGSCVISSGAGRIISFVVDDIYDANGGGASVDLGRQGSFKGLYLKERTAPSAPSTNNVVLYAEDNGSGKTRLMALFPTGAAQQVAIEP